MHLSCLHSPLRTLVFTALLYLFAPSPAQAQAPYLYASIPNGATSLIAGYSVGVDGTLKPVPGPPFNLSREGGLLTTDPTDQFLFVLNATTNTISVLSIDSNSGALTEVQDSPVLTPAPTQAQGGGTAPSAPTCMATLAGEDGNPSYLFVAYRNGPSPSTGAIVAYEIGGSSPPLTAVSIIPLDTTPIDVAVSPQGFIYAALQLIPNSNHGNQMPGVGMIKMDPGSGQLQLITFANNNPNENAVLLNPDATFLFDAEGSRTAGVGMVESMQIRSDGSTQPPQSLVLSNPNIPPSALLVDGSGQLLYVQQGAQVVSYTIDQTRGILSTSSTSATPPPFTLSHGNTVAHPAASYLYTLQSGAQIYVFEITDFTSGALRKLSDPPYAVAGAKGAAGLTLTHNAASQTGAAASLFPPAVNFTQTTVGQSISDNSTLLTNTGTEVLNVTASIVGADQSDFTATTCPPSLPVRMSCSITVTFKPAQSGTRQATLVVADSAGQQTLQLSGTGIVAQPALSVVPSALTFAPTAPGVITVPQSIILTNSGSANLHISSIAVDGQNAADFSVVNSPTQSSVPTACTTAAYAPGTSCSITVVFAPLAEGSRSTSIFVTDDAPGSPQIVQLGGTGLNAEGTGGTGNPSPNGPPAITVSATSLTFISTEVNSPTTEQYVIVTNSGADGSSLTITSAAVTGTNSADFKLANGCTTPVSPQTQGCALSVTFTPSASGTRTANLVITDNASPSTQTVALTGSIQTGTGTETETITITPGPNGNLVQSISAGDTATYLLSLKSTFGATVSFSQCVGAPSTATCTIAPASIVVTPNQSVPLLVTVVTAAAASSVAFDRLGQREISPLNIGRIYLAIACTILFFVIYKRAAPGVRPLQPVHSAPFAFPLSANAAIATLLVLSLLTFAGCGGASTVATAPVVTPTPTSASQTYTITITPHATTSDNIAIPNLQPIQLTLILD
jgi:6-phosphogluconolactonase (cycloisomerase 2 family)